MSKKGEVNGWVCEKCGETTYAIHVDDGVTPFYLGCRVPGECDGVGKSMFYPSGPVPFDVQRAVAFEWYMPDADEQATLKPEVLEHVEMGGLLIRDLTDLGQAELARLL